MKHGVFLSAENAVAGGGVSGAPIRIPPSTSAFFCAKQKITLSTSSSTSRDVDDDESKVRGGSSSLKRERKVKKLIVGRKSPGDRREITGDRRENDRLEKVRIAGRWACRNHDACT